MNDYKEEARKLEEIDKSKSYVKFCTDEDVGFERFRFCVDEKTETKMTKKV